MATRQTVKKPARKLPAMAALCDALAAYVEAMPAPTKGTAREDLLALLKGGPDAA